MTTHPSPAEDFITHHSWATREHAFYVAGVKVDDGTPYCRECHDWHYPNEDHSMTEDED